MNLDEILAQHRAAADAGDVALAGVVDRYNKRLELARLTIAKYSTLCREVAGRLGSAGAPLVQAFLPGPSLYPWAVVRAERAGWPVAGSLLLADGKLVGHGVRCYRMPASPPSRAEGRFVRDAERARWHVFSSGQVGLEEQYCLADGLDDALAVSPMTPVAAWAKLADEPRPQLARADMRLRTDENRIYWTEQPHYEELQDWTALEVELARLLSERA